MLVQDIMTPNPATVEVTDTIQEAVNVLNELDIRHLPVVDNGVLSGMISDRDLRDFTMPMSDPGTDMVSADDRWATPISQIMYADVLTVGSESDVTEVAEIMIDHKIGAVPVCDQIEGQIIGIVSYIDVLQVAADLLHELP